MTIRESVYNWFKQYHASKKTHKTDVIWFSASF